MVRPVGNAAVRTTMPLTLAEAAAACGLDRSTVRRAVKSGRISGTRDDLGRWHIEAAELHRVFPPAARQPMGGDEASPRDAAAADALADALVAELRATLADVRAERDRWREALEREQAAHAATQRLLLPTPSPTTPAEAPAAPPSPLARAWRWMRQAG